MLCLVAQSCLTLCNRIDCSLPGFSVHGDSPGKNTEVGCHALLQGTFPTQESNMHLLHLHWPEGSLPPVPPGNSSAAESLQSCPTLCNPIDGSPSGYPVLGFSRQEHWSGLPFPSPMQESEK